MTREVSTPQLLAPAGSFESLEAALRNGADAVYFGVGKLNMRSNATVNFSADDLPELSFRCHSRGAKAYLALNTILYDSELEEARELCRKAKEAGIDALIVSDPAVMRMANAEKLPVHLSVQANIANLETVRFYAQFADVAVLARELNLEQIAYLCRKIREEGIRGPSGRLFQVEIFIHGALCVAVSGKCYMSLAAYNSSANRGACFQNCRRAYTVRDTETGTEFTIDNEYVMSPRDLCTLEFFDRILASGVSILKIEGRGRSADYVAHVVRAYRSALDRWLEGGSLSAEELRKWEEDLASVFNRGFWKGGYYLGNKLGEWAGCGDSQATVRKEFLGKIVNFYRKISVAELRITSGKLRTGEKILVTGETTGAEELTVEELLLDGRSIAEAEKGMTVTFRSPVRFRVGDKVYLLTKRSPL